MNILFISAVYPYPLYSGGQVRIFNLLKKLGKRHSITLVSFIRDDKERQMKKFLPFVKENIQVMRGRGLQLKYVIQSVLKNQPMLISTYDNALMRNTIRDVLRDGTFDLIHAEPFYVMPSIPPNALPLVISEHNIEYDVYAKNALRSLPVVRPVLDTDASKVKTWEQNFWMKGKAITAVSGQDASVIREYVSTIPVTVVPNGVDMDQFRFSKHVPDAKHPNFSFVGNFSWMPNRDAVNVLLTTIWPAILTRLPDATISIVGKNIPPNLRQIPSRNVIWKEHVSDIREIYQTSDALVAPLAISGGSKFKILEALASGCPVITTKEGIYGLNLTSDEISICINPSEFASACASVILNPLEWSEKTKKARKIIEKEYSWNHIAEILEHVWEEAV